MKYLVTGGNGQLGYDLIKELKKEKDADVYAPTSKEMDITNQEQVNKIILDYKPNYIFHCAAYTAVDQAEEDRGMCYLVNVEGTRNIAAAAHEVNAKVIYISTDYVFNGEQSEPYQTDEICEPINLYGYTKYRGEQEVMKYAKDYLIARISWVFGINGKNFIKTMIKLAKEGKKEISVVCDQIGSPTYTVDLVKQLVDLKEEIGIYHITNEGYCSWLQLAQYVFQELDIDIEVSPVLTRDYKTKALRPLNSKLDKSKLKNKMPHWKDAVKRFLEELRREKE